MRIDTRSFQYFLDFFIHFFYLPQQLRYLGLDVYNNHTIQFFFVL